MNDLGVPLFQDINGGYRLVPSNMLITWCLLTNPLLMFPAINVRWARAFPNDMFNHQRVSWLMLIKYDKNQYHDFSFSSPRKPRRNHVFLSWGWNHISVTEQRCEQKCMDDGIISGSLEARNDPYLLKKTWSVSDDILLFFALTDDFATVFESLNVCSLFPSKNHPGKMQKKMSFCWSVALWSIM